MCVEIVVCKWINDKVWYMLSVIVNTLQITFCSRICISFEMVPVG